MGLLESTFNNFNFTFHGFIFAINQIKTVQSVTELSKFFTAGSRAIKSGF